MEGEDCVNNHDCNSVHFCDPNTKKCQKCSDVNCFSCLAADFCAICNKDYFADLTGKCTKDCSNIVLDGEFCDIVPLNCKDGQLSPCKCSNKLNCALCTPDKMSCSRCLTGFTLKNGDCEFCENGIDQTIGIQCLGKQCSNGCDTCTVANGCIACQAGYELINTKCQLICPVCKEAEFCDVPSKTCKSCNNDCKSCVIANNCTGCYPGSYLNGSKCDLCPEGCTQCQGEICQSCQSGFKLNGTICSKICDTNVDCGPPTFCSKGLCEKCSVGCGTCISADFCAGCEVGQYVDITGKCYKNCVLAEGEYCDKGVATKCGPGINSSCKCGLKLNCASCLGLACADCLPGFGLFSGSCDGCLEGYNTIGKLCVKIEAESKLSGGAIAGIVIAVVAVVGGVGGVAGWFLFKKYKR